MGEGILLPDGTVLFLNGAGQGAQGFGLATDPTLTALIYNSTAPLGTRWTTAASSTIPRLYHSVALLLLDGTVMVAGSNPVQMPVLTPSAENPFVTEFRVERYTPPYLSSNAVRPTDIVLSTTELVPGNRDTVPVKFTISFSCSADAVGSDTRIVLYHGGFVTHSLHMSHRMVYLDYTGWNDFDTEQDLLVTMAPNSSVTPPGPYVVYVVIDGVPGIGQFVTVA